MCDYYRNMLGVYTDVLFATFSVETLAICNESRVYCIFTACTMSSQRKFTFAISSPDEFLVCILIVVFVLYSVTVLYCRVTGHFMIIILWTCNKLIYTRSRLFSAKMHQMLFDGWAPPETQWGVLCAPRNPLTVARGWEYSKGRKGGEEAGKGEEKGRGFARRGKAPNLDHLSKLCHKSIILSLIHISEPTRPY